MKAKGEQMMEGKDEVSDENVNAVGKRQYHVKSKAYP